MRNIPDAEINMAAGRAVGDTTWRNKIRVDLAKTRNLHAAEVLWDVTKCFEHVDAHMLAQAAHSLGYPLDILAVSLTSYRWRRVIFFQDNISANPVWLGSGIVAGSPPCHF